MLSLSRIYQLSGRLSRCIHPTTLEVGDFYAVFVKTDFDIDSAYRDGLFDEEAQFMVYSKEDVQGLISLISQTLSMEAYK